jgi:hypothetical protein
LLGFRAFEKGAGEELSLVLRIKQMQAGEDNSNIIAAKKV